MTYYEKATEIARGYLESIEGSLLNINIDDDDDECYRYYEEFFVHKSFKKKRGGNIEVQGNLTNDSWYSFDPNYYDSRHSCDATIELVSK